MDNMTDLVKIKIMPEEDTKTMALFNSTAVPVDANYTLVKDPKTNQIGLTAVDTTSHMKFIGDNSLNKSSEYYLGVRRNGVLEVHSLSLFAMKPQIEVKARPQDAVLTPLTTKEQMDEINEKFGSRRSQRSLNRKRKYAIEFGEEDLSKVLELQHNPDQSK
jgi:hypothetical protein